MPYVIVQAEGDFEPLASWWIEGTSEFQEEQWERLCLRLVQEAKSSRRRRDRTTPLFNVFLLFHEEEFPDGFQQAALESLLDQAHQRIWGARLFFVIQPLLISKELDPIMDSLRDWMGELLKGRVTDLLQVRQNFTSENLEPLFRSLKESAKHANNRQQVLHSIADHRDWRCVFLTEQIDGRALVGKLLQPLVIIDPGQRTDSNLVLVVTDEIAFTERMEPYIEDPLRRTCLVATVKQEASDALRRYCEAKHLHPPLVFQGEFELWYFLLRLNQLRQWFPSTFHASESIHAVQTHEPEPILRPARQFPSLLFTSAFSSDHEQIDQWLAAAGEVGRLLREVPHALEHRVELEIQPERLIRALDSKPHPNVWIHMGHGSARSGLLIPGTDVTQRKWADCFGQCDLRLALFLTCDSHEIARFFAQSGAGVAIGFEGEVESDKTWYLAAEVLKAIFSRGMSNQVILEGFDAGAVRFRGVQTRNAKPRAYYPRGRG